MKLLSLCGAMPNWFGSALTGGGLSRTVGIYPAAWNATYWVRASTSSAFRPNSWRTRAMASMVSRPWPGAAEVTAGTFSVLGFYDRRMRRILPALLTMLALVLLAGRFLLMPGDYATLATSTAGAAFGVSNFYFLNHTGYFDRAADFQPLLHTWSLAVEEQFYVVWPLLLLGLTRIGSKFARAAICWDCCAYCTRCAFSGCSAAWLKNAASSAVASSSCSSWA